MHLQAKNRHPCATAACEAAAECARIRLSNCLETDVFMLIRTAPLLIPLLLLAAGCSYEGTAKLPGVYRIDIQQGNVVEEDMVARLRPGMDKNQVQYIMGTPVVDDPFHVNRWDYIYTYSEGGARRTQRHVVLYFENNKLARVGGDIVPAQTPLSQQIKEPSRTVDVPPGYGQEGFFEGLIDHIPFVGDDRPRPQQQQPVNTGDREAVPDSDGDEPGE